MKTPDNVQYLALQCTCIEISKNRWDQLMKNAVRANKRKIDSLVKKHLPDLFESLALNYYNPYNYYQTSTHLILVHSSIEYFLEYR